MSKIPQTPTYFLPVYIQYANLILSPSYILPVNIQLLPLLYPTYQHSPDPKISTHYSANFKNFPGGFAPRPLISPSCLHSTSPPYISFLSIFTRPQDFSSLPRKYQKFSWGLRPQSPDHLRYPSCLHSTMPPDPLINPSSNIQHLPLIYPSYRHSPDPKISS